MQMPNGASYAPLKFVLAIQCVLLAASWLVQGPSPSDGDRSGANTASLSSPAADGAPTSEGGLPSDLLKEQITLSNFDRLDSDELDAPKPNRDRPERPAPLLLAGFHSNAVSLTAPVVATSLSTAQSTDRAIPSRLVAYSLAKGDGGMFDRANRRRAGRSVGSGPGRAPGPIGGGIGGRGIGGRGGRGGGGACPGGRGR